MNVRSGPFSIFVANMYQIDGHKNATQQWLWWVFFNLNKTDTVYLNAKYNTEHIEPHIISQNQEKSMGEMTPESLPIYTPTSHWKRRITL